MLQRCIVMALLMLLATPAAAEWHLPCLLGLLGGCSTVIPLSREYAARPVQPLNPQAALEEVNAFRAKYGLNALARLSRAATIQSNDQARRDSMGHHGSDGSTIMDRAERVGYRPRIVAENVAYGLKSYSDVMRGWEKSSGHRENLLVPR